MAAQVTLRHLVVSMELIVQVGTLKLKVKTALNELLELSEVANGNRHELNMLKVDVCGTEDGSPVAWIQVNRTGLVTFSNINGNQSSCVLNDGLKAGSWCITTGELDKTNSPCYSSTYKLPTSTPSTSTPSTSTPSTSTPSTSTPSTSTSSTTTTKDSHLTIVTVASVTSTSTSIVWVTV
ncbi:hypothetical protein DTO013E5_10121 [Penicillium roqueforti]|jgi:hypothetical protein|nr:hypothetical protein CBS147318_5426 [Penicillium roqueforti]KAI3061794.1 hypothetical protein CBS147339_9977 [Penicillium roqueforti]KAI3175621.1 hypothetical protein DTO032C6_9951 [Penicillium roqueforti]KAI3196169.1 hypothetical protein DTO013E5_10121 [Penicillium roqueforti]KAI3223270.1 hypothetical protein DTO012A9_9852 [Penicillium roqueforti]